MSPSWQSAAIYTGIGVVGAAAASFVAIPILSAVGFTSAGVAAGSAAAAIQSGIGNVAAGSFFAAAQSAAATGAVGAAVKVTGGVVAGTVGALVRRFR